MSDHHELVFIGELAVDGEAEVISSLFEAHGLPLTIQGRQHRRMLGVLGGGYIHMRLLVPTEHVEQGRALLEAYYQSKAQESVEGSLESEEVEGEEGEKPYTPRRRWFTHNSKHVGIALLLSAFFGFGTASLYAGALVPAALFGGFQLALYVPADVAPGLYNALTDLAQHLGMGHEELKAGVTAFLPLFDFWVAAFWMLTRGRWGERHPS